MATRILIGTGFMPKTHCSLLCSKCGTILTAANQYVGTPWAQCKPCIRIRANTFNRAHPAKMQKYRLREMYGITPQMIGRIKKRQAGACGICFRVLPLHVDHDHKTGRVRGLLCRGCNLALGMLDDNISSIKQAVLYLSGGI